jgi:hypothetical protein
MSHLYFALLFFFVAMAEPVSGDPSSSPPRQENLESQPVFHNMMVLHQTNLTVKGFCRKQNKGASNYCRFCIQSHSPADIFTAQLSS